MSHLKNLQQKMLEQGLDAVLITEKTNQRYLSKFAFDDGELLITTGKAYLVTDFRYTEMAKESADKDFIIEEPHTKRSEFLRDLLVSNNCKKVALEDATLSHADFVKFGEWFKGMEVVGGASKILFDLRLRKDDEELATMQKAQDITDKAFLHILNFIKPEMTEMDVALELEFFMRKNGAEDIAFSTIAVSGANSSKPHGVPGRRTLEKGFLTMDYGAKVDGYCSDMTRTIVLGKADAEIKKLYNTVLKAQTSAIAAAKEGASCFGLDKIARDIIDAEPEFKGAFGHSLGHGVGLYIHENPRLSQGAQKTEVLERGFTFTAEPGIYLPGKYGCRIEDMLAIRPDGTLLDFTHSNKELIELF